jgi:arylformamidase
MSTTDDPVFQYLTGQLQESQTPLFAAFARESDAASAMADVTFDIPYGAHPRARFDHFAAAGAAATLVYLHGGYWQARDKAQFRFLAPAWIATRVSVVLANYPLCPDVTLATVTEAVRDLIPAFGDSACRIVVMGHSAGAHLAVELALTDWSTRGITRSSISGIVGLSGIYDLVPLRATPLNDMLRLDAAEAHGASPLYRIHPGLPRALFATGARETAVFHDQTATLVRGWSNAGNHATVMTVPGADHFSLLRQVCDPTAALFDKIRVLIDAPA